MTQDTYAPIQERKARPVGFVFDHSRNPIDVHAVVPDFGCRPISPAFSECSESSHATDDTTTSRIVGFGRKRHSIISTLQPSDDLAQSRIVGFGRKQRPHRHSVSGAPPALFPPNRKQENRRSLPNAVIPRDGSFVADPEHYRLSLGLASTRLPVLGESSRDRRVVCIPGPARKVSGSRRQPPRQLLLPQQVQVRAPPAPGRATLAIASVVSSLPVKFIISRFAAARRMRLKRLNLGRNVDERKSLLKRLQKLYRLFRGL
ncbi:hypothetical protein B0H14DRAFT_1309401 [Mycena olivaceomarginata]|nr:hypothetical protein B0H14DRAFT_1309401 [Mycena olivaceomarginata]